VREGEGRDSPSFVSFGSISLHLSIILASHQPTPPCCLLPVLLNLFLSPSDTYRSFFLASPNRLFASPPTDRATPSLRPRLVILAAAIPECPAAAPPPSEATASRGWFSQSSSGIGGGSSSSNPRRFSARQRGGRSNPGGSEGGGHNRPIFPGETSADTAPYLPPQEAPSASASTDLPSSSPSAPSASLLPGALANLPLDMGWESPVAVVRSGCLSAHASPRSDKAQIRSPRAAAQGAIPSARGGARGGGGGGGGGGGIRGSTRGSHSASQLLELSASSAASLVSSLSLSPPPKAPSLDEPRPTAQPAAQRRTNQQQQEAPARVNAVRKGHVAPPFSKP